MIIKEYKIYFSFLEVMEKGVYKSIYRTGRIDNEEKAFTVREDNYVISKECVQGMKNNLSLTRRTFLKEFPEIGIDNIKQIDINIKTKVMAYEAANINNDISNLIQLEIKKYVKSKNQRKINKKCNKLAALYLDNNRQWLLQENLFCLLAYFITITTMICRVLEFDITLNDGICFAIHFIVLGVWVIIVNCRKLMGKRMEKFLRAFNNQAPAITVFSSFIFYFMVCFCQVRIFCIFCIIVLFVACTGFTILWYKRQN